MNSKIRKQGFKATTMEQFNAIEVVTDVMEKVMRMQHAMEIWKECMLCQECVKGSDTLEPLCM